MNDFAAIATRRENFTVASSSRALSLFSSDYIPLLSYESFLSLPHESFLLFLFFFFLRESSPLTSFFFFSAQFFLFRSHDFGRSNERHRFEQPLATYSGPSILEQLGTRAENSRKFSFENSKVEQRVRVAELGIG